MDRFAVTTSVSSTACAFITGLAKPGPTRARRHCLLSNGGAASSAERNPGPRWIPIVLAAKSSVNRMKQSSVWEGLTIRPLPEVADLTRRLGWRTVYPIRMSDDCESVRIWKITSVILIAL